MVESRELIGKYFAALNHGFVALLDFMGGDYDIAEAARISYGMGTHTVSANRDLLRYLLRHKHTTPYEMVQLKFHVKLPIFVARQLVRHRTAKINEYSMRYSLAPMQFYVPELDNFQKQSKSNKQGRDGVVPADVYERIANAWSRMSLEASDVYADAILDEVARELARLHLPVSLYTEWIWNIDLHNLMHFLGLRSDSHAQWEIQQFSNIKAGIAKIVAPLAFEAWIDYRHCATSLSRMEWNVLRELVRSGQSTADKPGITARETYMRDAVDLEAAGLGKREIDEFLAKFSSSEPVPIPNFDLDLSTAKPASFYYEQALAALPEKLRHLNPK
jgi:thymidylate synthase (FAD)